MSVQLYDFSQMVCLVVQNHSDQSHKHAPLLSKRWKTVYKHISTIQQISLAKKKKKKD